MSSSVKFYRITHDGLRHHEDCAVDGDHPGTVCRDHYAGYEGWPRESSVGSIDAELIACRGCGDLANPEMIGAPIRYTLCRRCGSNCCQRCGFALLENAQGKECVIHGCDFPVVSSS